MKKLYIGYTKKDEKELKNLWENCLITFDTNVILNLYRYSVSTRKTILDLIEKLNGKIFLPYQVGLEYNRNRYEVISEQENSHKEFLKNLNKIEKDLESNDTPPFLSEGLYKSINDVFNRVENEVKDHIKDFEHMLNEDEIFGKIEKIFDNKITDNFSPEELEKVIQEGKKRYEKNIPPGYKDIKKPEDRKYGDLILWKQILEKAKQEKKPVILVSDENKEDWIWKLRNGKTIGPRQELIEEFKLYTEQDFHIYTSERFINYGQTYFEEHVDNKAIKEIEKIKKSKILINTKQFDNSVNKALLKSHLRMYELNKNRYNDYLEQISPMQADVLRLSMGLGSMDPMSPKEIGELFDLKTSQVNEVTRGAIEAMHKIIESNLRNEEP